MAIKFKDSFDHYSQPQVILGNSQTIKMYKQMLEVDQQMSKMQQIMKDVKTSVEYSWPGVYCEIHQSFNSPTWEIVLSQPVGDQICCVKEKVTKSALEGIYKDKIWDTGVWVITEVISKMLKQLEKVVAQESLNQTPLSASSQIKFQPKYYGVPLGGGNVPKLDYSTILNTSNPFDVYGNAESPKVESLDDMYDKAPVETKVKKVKSKAKSKLTAAETVNLKKQLKLGIPANLTLKQAKIVNEALTLLYGEDWLSKLEATEDVKSKVKVIVDKACPKMTWEAMGEIMDKQLKALKEEIFKSDPMLSYLKSPQMVKFNAVESGIQGVEVDGKIYTKVGEAKLSDKSGVYWDAEVTEKTKKP